MDRDAPRTAQECLEGTATGQRRRYSKDVSKQQLLYCHHGSGVRIRLCAVHDRNRVHELRELCELHETFPDEESVFLLQRNEGTTDHAARFHLKKNIHHFLTNCSKVLKEESSLVFLRKVSPITNFLVS